MAPRGPETRHLTTTYEQPLTLRRHYAVCAACAAALPPPDEELGLLPGPLTPRLQEGAARLGAWVPSPQAALLLAHFTRPRVSAPTVRRKTEQAGAAYVAAQAAAVAALERDTPDPPHGPPLQQVSVAGALVPLLGQGAWAEVKMLAIGTVSPPVLEEGAPVVHTTALSYFSRLADHATFTRPALVEAQGRRACTSWRHGARRSATPTSGRRATPSAAGPSRAPTRWWSRRG